MQKVNFGLQIALKINIFPEGNTPDPVKRWKGKLGGRKEKGKETEGGRKIEG
jgi:hypothetical protein